MDQKEQRRRHLETKIRLFEDMILSITKHLRDREYQKGADDHAEKTPENAV